jgi:hypothetical protein
MALLDFLTGGDAGKSEMKQANALLQQNIARLEAIGIPSVDAQKIALQNPELVGLLEAEQIAESGFEGISTDPRLRQAQMAALEEMSGLAQTGLGTADRSAFNELRRNAAAEAQAQQKGILAQQAARGMLDSGQTLAAQLQAGQSQANRMSQEGDRLAANAAEARRAALMQQANMSSGIRTQDYGQASDAARAKDLIAQFNAQNRQTTGATNLQNRQIIENTRAANANTQETYNKGLLQQNFQNQITKATGQNNATTNLANAYATQGANKAQGAANAAAGLVGIGLTVANPFLGAAASNMFAKSAPAAGGAAIGGLPTENPTSYFGGSNPFSK